MTNSIETKPATAHVAYGYTPELHAERPMFSDSPFFDHTDRLTVLYLRPDFETVAHL